MGRCPGPLERRRLERADLLDMSKNGRNCAIVIGAGMQEHLGFQATARHPSSCFEAGIDDLHEPMSMLTVPAPGQSN
jgi:hypothetical protein